MDADGVIGVFDEVVAAVGAVVDGTDDRGPSGEAEGQYAFDVLADRAAVPRLEAAGLGILSEESGRHHADREITVVIDPVDGSTNASMGIPWYATSLCAVDGEGPLAALVVNLATGERFEATRGGGARRNGEPITPSTCFEMSDAIVAVNGLSPRHLGWRQVRTMGAAALDLCSVACGRFDGYLDAVKDELSPWDYLGALLVCWEAGAPMGDAFERNLVDLDPAATRTIAAGATKEIFEAIVAAQSHFW